MRPSDLRPRRLGALSVVLALMLSMAACAPDDGLTGTAGRNSSPMPADTPTPEATPTPRNATPTPTPLPAPPTPTPTPKPLEGETEVTSPDPNATPAPTPTPRATPLTSSVQSVTVSPAQATLNLPAADESNAAGFPTSLQLSALVRLSDGTTATGVTWSAGSGAVSVSADGVVTAKAAGTVIVTATSQHDPTKSGSATITVERNGLLDLVID